MIRAPRLLWLLVLVCFACGCSSLRPARLTGTPADDPKLPVLDLGSRVSVDRRDGTRVSGRLRAVSEDCIIVETDYGPGTTPRVQTRTIPLVKISTVSEERTDLGRTLLLLGGFVVGFFAIVALDVAVNGLDFGGGNAP